MSTTLVSPWSRLRVTAPFVLPCDAMYIDAFNRGATPDTRIRTKLVAEPFFGNPSAQIVLLLLNPGVGESDARWHAKSRYRQGLLASVQARSPKEHFHLVADPSAPGSKWWRRACKPLTEAVDLRTLASRLLCVEFFPYHSKRFAHGHLRLPSQAYSFELVNAAIDRGAEIVCMRGERAWKGAVPRLEGYNFYCKLNSPQSSSLSEKNVPRFKRVIEVILGTENR
jgi:hypothetical protein